MSGYSPIQDPSFVGQEHWTDDENCEYELAGFHLLEERESRQLALCEMFYEEPVEEEVEESEDLFPDEPAEEEDPLEHALEHALQLQTFFARQRENANPANEPAEPKEPEVNEIVRRKMMCQSILDTSTFRPAKNARKPYIGSRTLRTSSIDNDRAKIFVIAVEVNGQRYRVARAS